MDAIRHYFPIFNHYPGLVYLDNAATTQKPGQMIDAVSTYYTKYNANAHRGLYKLADTSTTMYENARRNVAAFINAEPEEIIFTSGATESLNIIALSLQKSKIIPNKPTVLLSSFEHHSNLIPWQQIHPERIDFIDIVDDYQLSQDYKSHNTAYSIAAFSYVSNVTGTILPVSELVDTHRKAFTVIDASQAVGHMKVDVKEINCDFLVFSGHKMYGPQGIGILYVKNELLQKLQPVLTGGGMVREVSTDKSTWTQSPHNFEAGTPNIAGAVGLSAAIDFINQIGFKNISQIEEEIHSYALAALSSISGITLHHPKLHTSAGVISFSFEHVHSHDIAEFLGARDICIRAGHHCAQPLHTGVLQVPATARMSIGMYNTKSDIDAAVRSIQDAVELFTK